MISLRRGTIKDSDLAIMLEKSVTTHLYVGTSDLEEVKQNLEKNVVYFVESDSHVVGSVEYEYITPSHVHIWSLIILPEFQGKGIGRKVLQKVLEELREIPFIDLVTHPDNIRAINLYTSLGFESIGRKENYFGDGEPRMILEKRK